MRQRSYLRVVLVEPKHPGNVGFVARVCANFGVSDLVLVKPPPLDDRSRQHAVHAWTLLEKAQRVDTLAEALGGADLSVGFAAMAADKPQDHLRHALSLPAAAESIDAMDGLTALVFGREDFGLFNEELAQVDVQCQIPVSPDYSSMNVSHAVAVALYELAGRGRYRPYAPRAASIDDMEVMLSSLEHLLLQLRYPRHRVKTTILAWRRVVGRGRMTTYEFHRIMGVISETLKTLGAYPAPRTRWDPGPAFEDGQRETSASARASAREGNGDGER